MSKLLDPFFPVLIRYILFLGGQARDVRVFKKAGGAGYRSTAYRVW